MSKHFDTSDWDYRDPRWFELEENQPRNPVGLLGIVLENIDPYFLTASDEELERETGRTFANHMVFSPETHREVSLENLSNRVRFHTQHVMYGEETHVKALGNGTLKGAHYINYQSAALNQRGRVEHHRKRWARRPVFGLRIVRTLK